MNLKSACKTALVLTIVSIISILAGRVLSTMIFFFRQTSGSQNGWSSMPHASRYTIILMQLLNSFMLLLHPSLLLSGFITLLSACLKRLNDPQANAKKRHIVAAVLIGLAVLVMTWRTIGLIWITLRHQPYLSFQSGLSLCWHLIATLCALSLFISVVAFIRKAAARTPAILTIACHWLMVAVMVVATATILHRGLTLNSDGHFGPLYPILWFVSSAFFYSGTFLWVSAVLLFLFAWLKQKPWPPEAGVLDPSPEPAPVLSAEEPLPGEE